MEAGVRTEPRAQARAAAWRTVVRDYLTLTKPKVQSLLLFTTVTTMYVAGNPSVGRVVLTCLGGALSAGGGGGDHPHPPPRHRRGEGPPPPPPAPARRRGPPPGRLGR